jgi:hypothetical protein
MNEEVRIVVVGAHTPLGAEVARFAVSMGFEVIGLTPSEVDLIDPWHHGVAWKRLDALNSVDLGATAVVWTPGFDPNERQTAANLARQVYLSAESPMHVLSTNTVWLMSEGDPSLPLEQRAIAALRAAVEDGHSGILSRDEVAYLGDAMMLQ